MLLFHKEMQLFWIFLSFYFPKFYFFASKLKCAVGFLIFTGSDLVAAEGKNKFFI